jgi:Domain of unknown function (DUF4037)
VQGLELSRRFYFEAVRPILDRRFPALEHAAALIGWGSEVLGFDDEMSRDHAWGPRLQLFVSDIDIAPELDRALADELPPKIGGFPTNFGPTDEPGMVQMAAVEAGPIAHRVETLTLPDYLRRRIGVDPLQDGFTAADWLATPTQPLLELTAGAVFTDSTGELTRVRELLAWYPHDVWLFVMAGHWRRVAQFEHLHGRAGLLGDELGAHLLGAALVRDLMRLGFLQQRAYPPYSKWLGTAYERLGLEERAALESAVRAEDWRSREDALVAAYEAVARRHNDLGVTDPVEPTARPFWGRPIRVLFADRFVEALRAAITDPDVRSIDHDAGSIDAVSENTDVLSRPALWQKLEPLWAGEKTARRAYK